MKNNAFLIGRVLVYIQQEDFFSVIGTSMKVDI